MGGAPTTRARSARGGGRRVGELDEEMVYEAREGEVILLGASAWRIEQITHDRVLVSPAPGEQGKVPFWKGDGPGRPIELGRALGEFTREIAETVADGSRRPEAAEKQLREEHMLDELAARNLIEYLDEEQSVTGVLPTDRTIVLQRFRDELGDWRICLLTPFGARVHAPWALAIEARLRERLGLDVQPIWSDDGIVVRLPMTDELGGEGLAATVDGDGDGPGGGEQWPRPRRRCASDRRTSRSWSSARSVVRRCSRATSERTRRGRCCCRAAAPASARRCGRCASARPSCSAWPAATAPSRSSSRRTASASRTSSTCPR